MTVVENLPTRHGGVLAAEDVEQSSVAEEAPWSPFMLEARLFLDEDKPEDPDKRLALMLFISDFKPFIACFYFCAFLSHN